MAENPTEPEDTTEDLAGRAWRGDERSFQVLYERIAPALYAWARLRIRPASRVHVDPQDLVQKVWLRAVQAFERFDPRSRSFRAWVFTIAKNILLECFRQLRNAPQGDPDAGPSTRLRVLGSLPDEVTSITDRLARDESIQRFVDCVEKQDAEDRRILILCGLEGASSRDVAALLGLSTEAVAKRWQRLRARLREQPWARELLSDGG